MLLTVLAASCAGASPQEAEPAAGIDRGLAAARAVHVRDVRYELAFALEQPVREVRGEATIAFTLTAEWPRTALVLDFDGELLDGTLVNGAAAAPARKADHLVLQPELLQPGANVVRLAFRSAAAPAGTPLAVYRDAADGGEYCYTLVVPADAHRLYPCFDQPDLKASFTLALDLPAAWTAVANGAARVASARDRQRRWSFAATAPLPTYLMAFACGPFDVLELALPAIPGIAPGTPLRLLVRPSQRRWLDADALLRLHARGLQWLCSYFDIEYPFGKLDAVLVPGFPYGGMEHAGAIFYRERALLFDHTPTEGELSRRSTLIYHELSHQWFGNLVTMRWFDDLWLKEGFATFVAFRAMAELEPERQAWLRFLQRVKPRAYEVDGTPGTTPVFQELQNLADAKSAYGAIVYNKAPAVLRELHDRLGAAAFRKGLHDFLLAHRFGNATWQDLAGALEAAAATDLRRWSERWLLAPSMPRVRVDWRVDGNGVVADARLRQFPIGGSGTWPMRVELLVVDLAGGSQRLAVASDAAEVRIDALVGRAGVAAVLGNPGDVAYGQFLPDAASRQWIEAHVAETPDPLLRAVMVAALFEAVREAEFDPARFCAAALDLLAIERDADTHAFLLDLLATTLRRYVDAARALPLQQRATDLLLHQLGQLRAPEGRGQALPIFRFLARHGRGEPVLELCRAVALGRGVPEALDAGKEDRFLALAAVVAASDGQVEALAQALATDYRDQDVGREAFLARAATPSAEAKAEYFEALLQPESPPEQWAEDALAFFHWPGQSELTLRYLRPALERVDWVKRHRRIFFMPAWLDAFVNGHSSREALAIVDDFLSTATIEDDVRRKLLQSRDGLERAVRIRAAFARGD